MMSLGPQSHSPFPMQQHPGVQGHPMGMPHNPNQQIPGQPGMNPQMHMGVSGPGGPQAGQAAAMMGGMPPGAGGPSQHALQHLNPQAAQAAYMQQQQQMAFANNPNLQAMQQQQQMQMQRQQQAARAALMQQQYSGNMPVMMPNGMTQMNQMTQAQAAQYAQMRGNPGMRPVNLPQHLQQAQQQVAQQQMTDQQQAQAQLQQQHNMMQQLAMQQGGIPGQLTQQQAHSIQQAQLAAHQHQQQQQQQHHQQQQAQAQAQAAAAAQQNQAQGQPQPQQSQANPQAQAQQPQPQAPQPPNIQQQQQAAAMLQQQQQRQGDVLKRGQCMMILMQFADNLSHFPNQTRPLASYLAGGTDKMAAQEAKQRDDLKFWSNFVGQFFSPTAKFHHSIMIFENKAHSDKKYEITYSALPRYFHTHFESGIHHMQLIMEKPIERELTAQGQYHVESKKASFIYWFEGGSQLIASGSLTAQFNSEQKLEVFDFVTSHHEEYLPRNKVIEAARPLHEWGKEWKVLNPVPEGKQSPEMNKKKAKVIKSPAQPPPDIDLPQSRVKPSMGVTPAVFRFLELVEVIGQMGPLFAYSNANPTLTPYNALHQFVENVSQQNGQNKASSNPQSGPRTPGMSNFGASPGAAHLQLPDGSPHMGSPAQAPGMQLQQSQHGTTSSGPSANTSPNASNKRRRPSAVKAEEDQANGTARASVKPSPKIGGKRQKPNNS